MTDEDWKLHEDSERAARYVLKNLTDDEIARFEAELARSETLRQLVEVHELTIRAIRAEDLAKFIGLVLGVQGVREVTAPSIEKGIEKPFLIRDRSGVERIAPSDIMYCRGAGRCTEIYVRADQEATRSRKRVSSKVLRQVLEELPQNGYIRAHKQTIVNISYVKKYVQRSPHARASARVLMFDGCWLEVSRRNTGLVLTAYEQ